MGWNCNVCVLLWGWFQSSSFYQYPSSLLAWYLLKLYHIAAEVITNYMKKNLFYFVIASKNPYHWIHYSSCRNYATTWNFSYIQESLRGNRHYYENTHVSWYRMAQQKWFVMSNTPGRCGILYDIYQCTNLMARNIRYESQNHSVSTD